MSDSRSVRIAAGGPILIEGPVRIETPDGSIVESDRFIVALCVCRRSSCYPLCDTSHRRKRRSCGSTGADGGAEATA
ncbi:CDGSH iron-sulfur domain-containing protein [Mycolicibacterium brumae]|uniref:CDGSH iron-sulfur domain-containing protein n=1 Tax=Mycolicibacterium brumae TaxID=85968 RepID=A0A2G5PBM5_9MYCO|nr:CDGSH iron-sulfur domain-containing protein [Mycolicibacterium brumae]MCV7191432.1 CDGSH iron-sulfur domain-containing protein [Mycolicibacterium brumae]PIB75752.1 CDGSH iron-sulfur domain-containing protein [Mycolicibacterium brumae]RWA16144.1 hypothetical protein MBRU_08525 [Mycolicibacterium brumae DSM 44177]UWW09460.1 CDGSH iron-sulfur domain-containing protein [Mycolicibacterium brumae]